MASANELVTTQRKAGVDLTDWQYRIVVPGAAPGVFIKANETDVFGFVLLNAPRKGESAQVAMVGRTLARIEDSALPGVGSTLIVGPTGGLARAVENNTTRLAILLENVHEDDRIAEVLLFHMQTGLMTAMLAGIEITSSPPEGQNGYYKQGDDITLRATFNSLVNYRRGPAEHNSRIAMSLDGGIRYAHVTTQNGDGVLFTDYVYSIQDADRSDEGIVIPANAFDSRGQGFVQSESRVSLHGADLQSAEVAADPTQKVDGVIPRIQSVVFTTNPRDADVGYVNDDFIFASVTFNEPVHVVNQQNVFLAVDVGGVAQYFTYFSGDNTNTFMFRGRVTSDWLADADGMSFLENPIVLTDEGVGTHGAITDIAGNALIRTLAASAVHATQIVRDPSTIITGIAEEGAPAGNQSGRYKIGDTVSFRVTFSGPVTYDATAGDTRSSIRLFLQRPVGVDAQFAYRNTARGGTDFAIYEYVVIEGVQTNANFPLFSADVFALGDDVITGANGAALLPEHVTHATAVTNRIAGIRPRITSIEFFTMPAAATGYVVDEHIGLYVKYDRTIFTTHEVDAVDDILLPVNVGGVQQDFHFTAGRLNSSTDLIFRGTVAAGWTADADGMSIDAGTITLTAVAAIRDIARNDAVLTYAAVATQANQKVNV